MKCCLLLLAAALAAACSTTAAPGVCCIGSEACGRLGLDEDRPCPAGQACVDLQCAVPSCTNQGCTADAPICEAESGACRGCRADAECPSGACAESGACAAEEDVLYVSIAGAASGPCTRAAPCVSIQIAAAQSSNNRQHVVLEPGTYVGLNDVGPETTPAASLHIHGHGATLTAGPGLEGLLFHFRVPGTVRDLDFVGVGIIDEVAIATTPALVERVRFSGIKLQLGGNLTIRDFSIVDSPDFGIYATGAVTAERGEIRGGTIGIRNDNSSSPVVDLSNILISRTSGRALDLGRSRGRVRFVTVANVGVAQTPAPHAVECRPGLSVEASIVWSSNGFTEPALGGGCALTSTIVGPTPISGAVSTDPLFVDPAAGDFHLQANSPARDIVDAGPPLDFERDPRPRGPRFDIGADEAP